MDFSLDLWICHWICGFVIGFADLSLDLWICHWICGFVIGFVDFTLDLWILHWIFGFYTLDFGFSSFSQSAIYYPRAPPVWSGGIPLPTAARANTRLLEFMRTKPHPHKLSHTHIVVEEGP